jgi:hypothetical protein
MPDPSLLSPLGLKMQAALPPPLRNSYDYLAIIHACAREFDLLSVAAAQVQAQFNPATADILLNAWEFQVRLPVGGNGADLATRRANVLARIRKLLGQSEGLQWVQTLDGILGVGWSYQEHDTADGSSPPANTIKITVPFASGTPEYLTAQTQVRDVTAAHLALEWESTSIFMLDVSELDVQDLGV